MPFDGTKDQSLVTLIERAQEILRRDGWTRGEFGRVKPGNAKCVLGAIYAAAYPDDPLGDPDVMWNDRPLPKAIASEVEARTGIAAAWTNAVDWNDYDAESIDDALDFLEGVKRRLKEM